MFADEIEFFMQAHSVKENDFSIACYFAQQALQVWEKNHANCLSHRKLLDMIVRLKDPSNISINQRQQLRFLWDDATSDANVMCFKQCGLDGNCHRIGSYVIADVADNIVINAKTFHCHDAAFLYARMLNVVDYSPGTLLSARKLLLPVTEDVAIEDIPSEPAGPIYMLHSFSEFTCTLLDDGGQLHEVDERFLSLVFPL